MSELKHLITSDDVSERTIVQLNASPKKINVAIPLAEGARLQPLIGQPLFDELLLHVQQESPDVQDPLSVLADKVKDMLSAWTVVEGWDFFQGHVSDAGIVLKNGKDVSSTADLQLTDRMLARQQRTAEYHTQVFVRWIEQNKAQYPSYAPPRTEQSTMPVGGLDCD